MELRDFWRDQAQEQLKKVLDRTPNTNVAKNIIMFLGDGMGVTTVTAARILKGQLQNKTGEETSLSFDDFPYVSLVKTYNTDYQTSDSAGTATAFLCGVKTKFGVIGLDDGVNRADCLSQEGREVTSILDWSLAEGKSVGFVTTARVTHATPAGTYAHSSERNWENDDDLSVEPGNCTDIALQLVEDNPGIQVILGGGRRNFETTNSTNGRRTDGRDLIKEWIADKENKTLNQSVVHNREELENVDTDQTDFLLGLFDSSHMEYEVYRNTSPTGQPSLEYMTKVAIKILEKNPKGFFLLVEAGRIDHGHHGSRATRALHETLMMDNAVNASLSMTDESETLTVVTADHSHAFAIAGYARRGTPILGLEGGTGSDGLPYTTLVYGNGPGAVSGERENLTDVDTAHRDYRQQSVVPLSSETHAGEDVAVYAIGPMSHLFYGTQEQSYIPHAMAYAACVGENKDHCDNKEVTTPYKETSTTPEDDTTTVKCFISGTVRLFQPAASILSAFVIIHRLI